MRVYKYSLEGLLTDFSCKVQMPAHEPILEVAFQNSVFGQGLMAWVLVRNREPELVERSFVLVPTGAVVKDSADAPAQYIKSLVGGFGVIMHLFENTPVVLGDHLDRG